MAQTRVRIGDVFSVDTGDGQVRFFQYIGNDSTQLDSEIIRVYKNQYSNTNTIDLESIIAGEIDWHAHCFLRLGLKMGYWSKVGKAIITPGIILLFRDTYDYGRGAWQEPVLVSYNWVVWHPGQDFQRVGRLAGENEQADIGLVMSPVDIVYRMQHGVYDMPFYPSF
jgi:hypothetical protein